LAAAAVGLWLERDADEIRRALESFRPLPMRMQVEEVGGVTLIHDAYNANPRSTVAALHEVGYRGGGGRRVAVLGDMLELGRYARALHAGVGRAAAEAHLDLLWAVGPLSEEAARAARDAGLGRVYWSPSVKEALAAPPFTPRPGDAVLFKASRRVGLERIHDALRLELRSTERAVAAPEPGRSPELPSLRT
ncbi:MAG: glutamate ligase domain-containing protein, partial [Planctomycetota bacterium]